MDIKTKHKLKKLVRELDSIRGRHTELVSVYLPQGYDINKAISHLSEEQGTASNIKDSRTRKNVQDSLEKAVRTLRLYKRIPENGIAIFAGNASDDESKVDIKVWTLEPPEPFRQRIYRCDQTFKTDLIKELMEYKEVYGLIVMDRREATIGILKGPRIDVLTSEDSVVPGKFKAGGQSAQRFHRLIEGLALAFYKKVAMMCNQEFLPRIKEIKGIIIGGPGHSKNEFAEELNQQLKDKIIAIQDITYTDESGLHHLVEKSKDILAKEAITEEKEIMNRFLVTLAKEPGRAVYGEEAVKEALNLGAVEVMLLSEKLADEKIEEMEALANNFGTEVKLISIETREGVQLKDLKGIAAILRYPIK